MRQLNGTYTQTFNKKHHRVGHIFQSRFRAVLIQKDTHLLELSRYVVLNPVRAGMVETPEQWLWSSYRATKGLSAPDPSLNSQWILSQFGPTTAEARRRYEEFVHEGVQPDRSPWDRLKGGVIFGSEKFAEEIQEFIGRKERILEPKHQRHVGRPNLEALFPQAQTIPKSQRDITIVEAHVKHGYELKEIADHLGVHYTTISKIVKGSLQK